MLPLAPIRSLLLGIISWITLGVGIYLCYDAYRLFTTADSPAVIVEEEIRVGRPSDVPLETEVVDLNTVRPASRASESERWTKLGLGILCLGITFVGRLPVQLLFHSSSGGQTSHRSTTPLSSQSFTIKRPCGSRLHGQVYGVSDPAGKRPTLILTHGWSLDSTAWKCVLPELTAKYRIVTWDLAGLGKSIGPDNRDYSLEKMSGDLRAIIENTCPRGPVVLVGHSIGGMIQQTFGRTHRDALASIVKGMVLVHTTYTNPLSTNIAAGIAKPLQPLIRLINLSMIPLAPLYWLSNWQSYWNGTAHIAARIESFTGRQTWEQLDFSAWKGAAASPSVLARGNEGMLKFDEQATLPAIPVPVLVISGEHDRLTIPQASRDIEAMLKDVRQLTNPGGHLGYFEYSTLVSDAILQFAGMVFDDQFETQPQAVTQRDRTV